LGGGGMSEVFVLKSPKEQEIRKALSPSRASPSQITNAQSTKCTPSPFPSSLFISN